MKKLLYIFTFIALSSCEVQYSMLDTTIKADTFSVAIFEEQAANAPAGYGINFTEFLRNYIVSRSKLKLKSDEADIEISGKIVNYYTAPISVQSDQQAANNRLTIAVEVSVINNKDEKESFEKRFSQFSDYDATFDLSSVEDELLRDINDKLSQDILMQLSSNW
ncbi:LPS assembly lipoprotein LptE [Paracrocinitomix mangrovi]|uniref:LPS assembly lipoprotein LptE n=1 Tax=Paracrocinitomix mangrovi TaxID=2862509 RepID=UPI001C8DA28A|nr:LPS assembly lipoprotein LptE [Paracrocinitomix mangrovi]UKN03293.1 LPS assembly lipoprotein LptE [Paracrocinitomix mangrovi]